MAASVASPLAAALAAAESAGGGAAGRDAGGLACAGVAVSRRLPRAPPARAAPGHHHLPDPVGVSARPHASLLLRLRASGARLAFKLGVQHLDARVGFRAGTVVHVGDIPGESQLRGQRVAGSSSSSSGTTVRVVMGSSGCRASGVQACIFSESVPGPTLPPMPIVEFPPSRNHLVFHAQPTFYTDVRVPRQFSSTQLIYFSTRNAHAHALAPWHRRWTEPRTRGRQPADLWASLLRS
eukprot:59697-Rhodomonas_salina.1